MDGAETKVLILPTKGGNLEVFGFCGIFFGKSLELSEFILIFATEWEGPARQKKRYAPNLRNENLGNFQSKADKSRRAKQLPRYVRGAVLQFLLSGFPRTFVSELVRQSRASAVYQNEE